MPSPPYPSGAKPQLKGHVASTAIILSWIYVPFSLRRKSLRSSAERHAHEVLFSALLLVDSTSKRKTNVNVCV